MAFNWSTLNQSGNISTPNDSKAILTVNQSISTPIPNQSPNISTPNQYVSAPSLSQSPNPLNFNKTEDDSKNRPILNQPKSSAKLITTESSFGPSSYYNLPVDVYVQQQSKNNADYPKVISQRKTRVKETFWNRIFQCCRKKKKTIIWSDAVTQTTEEFQNLEIPRVDSYRVPGIQKTEVFQSPRIQRVDGYQVPEIQKADEFQVSVIRPLDSYKPPMIQESYSYKVPIIQAPDNFQISVIQKSSDLQSLMIQQSSNFKVCLFLPAAPRSQKRSR